MKLSNLAIIAALLLFAIACKTKNNAQEKKLVVISRENTWKMYSKWLQNYDTTLQTVSIYGMSKDSVQMFLKKASGIVITGGTDVNPAYYGKEAEIKRCETINEYRDSLELELIKYAKLNNIPLLGICRGFQLMNVEAGGTLIIDIPTDYGSINYHRNGTDSAIHYVHKSDGSILSKFAIADSGSIVSHHHQGVEKLANDYKATFLATDKMVEAIEPKDTAKYRFLFGVQWHPERMDYTNPYSAIVAKAFLESLN